MLRLIRAFLMVLFAAILVGVPYQYYLMQRARFRNLRVVEPGVLYRSGQLDAAGLEQVAYDFGIGTIINLREESKNATAEKASWWERGFCQKQAIRYVQIPPAKWWVSNGPPPARDAVEKFLAIMRDPENYPRPVLIHCFAGQHRSGAFCAIYRMEFQGWTAEQALEEMRQLGYDHIDEEWDVQSFVRSYATNRTENPKYEIRNTKQIQSSK